MCHFHFFSAGFQIYCNHIYNNKEKANKEKIGKILKEFRKNLDLSQQKFSDVCHIPQSTYSHYEIGYKLITTFNLYTISKTYNVSLDYLVGRNDNPTIEQ